MFRKLFALAALSVVLGAILGVQGASADAHAPCWTDPIGICDHWKGSVPRTIFVTRYQFTDSNFVSALDASLSNFNASQQVVRTPASQFSSTFPGSPSAGCYNGSHINNMAVCFQSYSDACGANPANTWLACTNDYLFINFFGTPQQRISSHIAGVDTRIANPAHYSDGSTYTWGSIANDRRIVTCHEVTGHGMGLNHDVNNPDTSSCLHYALNGAATTLNPTVIGEIVTNTNHGDYNNGTGGQNDCQGYCYSLASVTHTLRDETKLSRKAGLPKFAINTGSQDELGRVVYVIPHKYVNSGWNFPKKNGRLAVNPYAVFITSGTPEAFVAVSPAFSWTNLSGKNHLLSKLGL